jgi:hypothetical protein
VLAIHPEKCMSTIHHICRNTPSTNRLKGLGVIAGVAVASVAAAVCYQHYRKRQAAQALALMPGVGVILPYLDTNSRALLASFGKLVPPPTATPTADWQ